MYSNICPKIQKIPEFNLIICNLSRKLPEIFMSLYVFFPQVMIFPGLTPLSIGHYWTIIQNDYLVKYILWPIMGMWSIKCVICMFLMFEPVASKPVDLFFRSSPGLGLLLTRSYGRLSVRRRPIFIYYHLCVVVYLKYWNIQILSYRKNKYMSIRFSQFPSFSLIIWDHLKSIR